MKTESIFALAEFQIGDLITYHPYEQGHKRKVTGYRHGANGNGLYNDGTTDNRLFYHLGTESVTTGTSIEESALFEPWTEEIERGFWK
jgi:hypothetical protein